MDLEYRQALAEVDFVLKNMSSIYYKKIPVKLREFIDENMDASYVHNITKGIPLNEQVLKKDTKVLLAIFYKNYWCESNTVGANEAQNQTFSSVSQNDQTSLIECSNNKWYKVIFDKILSCFKLNKKRI